MKLTIEEFMQWVQGADAYQTLESPILQSLNIFENAKEPDEEFLYISWTDSEFSEDFYIKATVQGILDGEYDAATNSFVFEDHEGDTTHLLAFRTIPHVPKSNLKDALTIVMDLAADNILEDEHVADDPEVLQEQQDSQNAAYETVQAMMKGL